jgi:hypothetical protein
MVPQVQEHAIVSADVPVIERTYSLRNEAFAYHRLEIRPDPLTGGQLVSHEIEANGPQREAFLLFSHFRPVDAPGRNFPKMSPDTPDSRRWRPGERMVVRQTIRLPAGRYNVFVGFATRGVPRRMPLGLSGDLLPLGSVSIEAPPMPILQRSAALLPADMDHLLEQVLALRPTPGDQHDHLTLCFGQAPQFGYVLEFGVAGGKSITHLATLAAHRPMWGFDTFEGLPEAWARGDGRVIDAGTFSQGGQLPVVPDNVTLVKGLLQATLPPWLSENPGNVAFLHIDVDLYSAAIAVLEFLDDRIVPGTVIVFDDVAIWSALEQGHAGAYDKWMEGEWRALHEWAQRFGRRFAVISRLVTSVMAIRVLN